MSNKDFSLDDGVWRGDFEWETTDKKRVIFKRNPNGKFVVMPCATNNQPLFTTEDGNTVYEGDKFVIVELPSYRVSKSICINHAGAGGHGNQKYFSTEVAANEYVLLNKPCLSLSDILKSWHSYEDIKQMHLAHAYKFYENDIYWRNPLFLRLKELVKSKINNKS